MDCHHTCELGIRSHFKRMVIPNGRKPKEIYSRFESESNRTHHRVICAANCSLSRSWAIASFYFHSFEAISILQFKYKISHIFQHITSQINSSHGIN